MSRQSALAMMVLLAMLGLALYPNAYAWGSSPQITYSVDGSRDTILTIQFDFSQMSDPPTPGHYPTDFQVRTSTDGSSWTELPAVAISATPTTTVFTETYNPGAVSGDIQVQTRLRCSIHGWSTWGPDPAVPVPEFPSGAIAVMSLLVLASGFFLFTKRRTVV